MERLTDFERGYEQGKTAAMKAQEPVAWYDKHGMVTHDPFEGIRPLYAAPRPWVGLTDEEVNDIVWNLPFEPGQDDIRAIEQRIKEKNGGEIRNP